MTSDESESRTLHIPPRYNLRGRRQLWFIETGNDSLDDPINGMLTALVVFTPLLLASSL
jgi:hypothetical protein